MADNIKIPDYRISWNGKSASDLVGEVSAIVVEDYEHGQADSIELTFQDVKKIWQGDWYPERGDIITLKIGYKDEPLLDCGTFELDEIQIDMPPDHLTVRARSAFASKKLKQANSVRYEKTTLREMASSIAGVHTLDFQFEGENVTFESITQYRESDLVFLRRLADLCGFILKITDKKLVLYARELIEDHPETVTLTRADVRRLSLRETSTAEIKTARSAFYDYRTNKVHEAVQSSAVKPLAPDESRIYDRAENPAHSIRYAKVGMRDADYRRTIGVITTLGNQELLAGINIKLKDYKQFDGLYFVEHARHEITGKERYETHLVVKRVKV